MSDYFKSEVKREPDGKFSYRDVPDFSAEDREVKLPIESTPCVEDLLTNVKTLKEVEDEVLKQ